LPALRAAANVVMGALTLDRYGNLVVGTLAIQRTASEVCSGGFDALVDRWMDGKCISHGQFPPLIRSPPGSHCQLSGCCVTSRHVRCRSARCITLCLNFTTRFAVLLCFVRNNNDQLVYCPAHG